MARVLVLDDEAKIRMLVRRVLERVGHQVVEASSGHDVVALLEQESFDLLVTDLHMPEMLGSEVIARARRVHPHLPTVLMTGSSGSGDLEGAGASMILHKPFGLPELTAAIESALAS